MSDLISQQLGNYELHRILGRGGFATVYLGEHIHLGTQAAVKVLNVQVDKETSTLFRQEARTIAHLEHAHIVRVLDFGIERDTPFLVMSYAPNGSLHQLHPKGTIVPLATIASYLKQIAPALQYAHDEKIIHRDIKPENLLLSRHNDILLSDFGIALTLPNTGSLGTQDMLGTAAYMAPEQIQGRPRFASDQYALAIVVYEWLCGKRPFSGNQLSIAYQHIHAPLPSLRERVPSISLNVEAVMLKALAKEPQQRFSSVQEFANAFEQVSQSTDRHATPTGLPIADAIAPPSALNSASLLSLDAQPTQDLPRIYQPPTDAPASPDYLLSAKPTHKSPMQIPYPVPGKFSQPLPVHPQSQSRRRRKMSLTRLVFSIVALSLIVLFVGYFADNLFFTANSSSQLGNTHSPQQQGTGTISITTTPGLSPGATHPVPLGHPLVEHVSYTEVANGTTSYALAAQAVSELASGALGGPIHASGITCKLWLVQQIPGNATFALVAADLRVINTIQNPLTGRVQGQPWQEVSGLTFSPNTSQTRSCDVNGQGIWQYTISASVTLGKYDLVVLTDWEGVHYNWSWVSIQITH